MKEFIWELSWWLKSQHETYNIAVANNAAFSYPVEYPWGDLDQDSNPFHVQYIGDLVNVIRQTAVMCGGHKVGFVLLCNEIIQYKEDEFDNIHTN